MISQHRLPDMQIINNRRHNY